MCLHTFVLSFSYLFYIHLLILIKLVVHIDELLKTMQTYSAIEHLLMIENIISHIHKVIKTVQTVVNSD
jgi:hypothetical protein